MGHAQCGFCSGTPPLFRTQRSDDSGGFSVETSTLHSDAHNHDSGGSSQAFPTPSLETPWPSEVRNLGPRTSVRSSFYQRALPLARNQTSVLHSLAPSNQRTDRTRQPGVGPVPLALRERMAKRLVRSITYSGIPTQQPCPLRYPTASVPARHQTTSSHGLRTPTKPFQSGESQRIHGEDENGDRRSEIHDTQSTGQHEKVLRPTQNSGPSIQPWRQSLPRRIGYPDYASFAKTLASMAWPLCSGAQDRTYGLPPEAAT